jgi:hypothetical protein
MKITQFQTIKDKVLDLFNGFNLLPKKTHTHTLEKLCSPYNFKLQQKSLHKNRDVVNQNYEIWSCMSKCFLRFVMVHKWFQKHWKFNLVSI